MHTSLSQLDRDAARHRKRKSYLQLWQWPLTCWNGLVAVLALAAAGASIGTRFLAIVEASVAQEYLKEGDIESLALWAGQGAGLDNQLQTVGEIVREFADEAPITIQNFMARLDA